MFGRSQAGHIRDPQVIGWIAKRHFGLIRPQHLAVALREQGVTACDPMVAEMPNVARPRHRGRVRFGSKREVVFLVNAIANGSVDLAHFKATDEELGLWFERLN